MSHIRVARRYASALMSSANETNKLQQVSDDLSLIRQVIKDSKEFAAFLCSPVVKVDKKTEVLEELFASRVQPLTWEFIRLVALKRREEALEAIADEFFRLRDVQEKIVRVKVKSSTELSSDQTAKLIASFERLTGKNVRIAAAVDASLVGGFVARVGDTMYDGSVRHQLEVMRKRLAEGTAS